MKRYWSKIDRRKLVADQKGVAALTIYERELQEILPQIVKFSVKLVKADDTVIPGYIGGWSGTVGEMEIIDGVYSTFEDSITIDRFDKIVPGQTELNKNPDAETYYISKEITTNNNPLHVATLYTKNYYGTITVEGRMTDENIDAENPDGYFFAIDNIDYGDNYIQWNGIYQKIRFKHVPAETNEGSINKIIYRN